MFDSDRAGAVHLFTMDGHGGDVRQVTSGDGYEGYPSISPDGTLVVYDDSSATADLGLHLMDPDGSHDRWLIAPPPDPETDTLPALSPECQRVAFERRLDGTPGQF